MKTVICAKWGTRYGPEFANRLYSMVRRNIDDDLRFICFADDKADLRSEIEFQPLPSISLPPERENLPWRKIALWKKDLAGMEGDIMYIDLDMVITGNLDVFWDYKPGKYRVVENFTQRGMNIGNTSLYIFPMNEHSYIFDNNEADPEVAFQEYGISQKYISGTISEMHFWPRDWVVSFKHDLLPKWPMNFFLTPQLKSQNRAVAFTGKPDQNEAAIGKYPVAKAYKKLYKYCKPTPWITENWR